MAGFLREHAGEAICKKHRWYPEGLQPLRGTCSETTSTNECRQDRRVDVLIDSRTKVGYEFTSNVDTGTSEWEIDEGHPLMEALEGLLEDDGIMPRHALVSALVGVHG